jgi:pimeloyl-ACP methyl ester carboxylesterase
MPPLARRLLSFPRRLLSRRALITFALCAAACLLLGSCLADRLILGTDPGPPPNTGGATRHLVQSQGRTIECWIARSPAARTSQPQAYVLFFPGKGSRADAWTQIVADAWAPHAVEVWGVNYPGFGQTTGPARLDQVAPTALAAYDALARTAAGRPVFLQAASFGTAPALHVAAQRPQGVAGLVLHKPPPLRELILGHYGWWNLWLIAAPAARQLPTDLDSLANARTAKAPAIFLLHGGDGITPLRYQRQIATAYTGPKQIIEMTGAAHDAPLTKEAAEQLRQATDWLWQSTQTK